MANEITDRPVMTLPVDSPREHRSVFQSACWLRRDAFVGIGLWLVLMGTIYLPAWTSLGRLPHAVLFTAGLVSYLVVLVFYPAWMVRRRLTASVRFWLGTGRLLKELAIALPVTLGLLVVIAVLHYAWNAVFGYSPTPSRQWAGYAERLDLRLAVLLAVLAITIGPVVEEVFFRGFLYNALRRVCPAALAAALQSVFFAVSHCYYYYPEAIVLTGCMGLALAGIYEWRRTLLAPIFAHAMYNTLAVIAVAALIAANANVPVLGVHAVRDARAQLVVDRVFSNTGAEKANLRTGDVILSYNGAAVNDFQQLIALVHAGRVGDTVRLEVLRDNAKLVKRIVLGRHGDTAPPPTTDQ